MANEVLFTSTVVPASLALLIISSGETVSFDPFSVVPLDRARPWPIRGEFSFSTAYRTFLGKII